MLMFVETRSFSRLVYGYISDVEYAALQAELAQRPGSRHRCSRFRRRPQDSLGALLAAENAVECA